MRIISVILLYAVPFISLSACNSPEDDLDNEEYSITKEYNASIYAYINGIGIYNGIGAQGFATSGNIGFCFYDSGYCQTIDLDKKTIIAPFMLPEGVANSNNHCGVACFSDIYFDEVDKYPLLYLSSYKEYKCYVLRMTEASAELVQVIQMKDEGGEISPVYAFMPDGDMLLLKTNMPAKENNTYTYVWKIANRPKITEEKNAYLRPQDIQYSFSVESSDAYNAGFCKNKKIYQLAGYGGYGSKKIYIIDYIEGIVLKEIVWQEDFLYNKEQEQCSPYGNDGMLINYNGGDYISYIQFSNFSYDDVSPINIVHSTQTNTAKKKYLRKGKVVINNNGIKYNLDGIHVR